ncbi:glycosyltransferase family 2 protein, partial [Candidatus Microgenomates bacterium]|nr:glycosyltransferase family 2 protein [Candidatus Microgenomates bacterium]
HAQYDLVCMIDADLQYSPKYIPAMIQKIEKGADIVVANRHIYKGGLIRKMCSKAFNFVFVQLLHRFNVDAQSGLKVFRRSVIEHIEVNPSPWTFDLEFLLKARRANYSIGSVNIEFIKRHAGESKVAIVKSSYEIGLSAIKLRLSAITIGKEKETRLHVPTSKFVH